MNGLTLDQLMVFAAVCVVLIGIYNSVVNAVNNHEGRKEKASKPYNDLVKRVDGHDDDIKDLKNASERLKGRTDTQDEEMRLILRSQLALIRHGVDGNNIQGLKDSQKDIQDYLIEKK